MQKLRDIAISSEDIYFETEGIDLVETYKILEDNEEYIITKKDLRLILQSELDSYILDKVQTIHEFELYITTCAESSASVEWEHTSNVWFDRLYSTYRKMHSDYLSSLDKITLWNYIPFSYEDLYNKTIDSSTRGRLNIPFETVFKSNDYLNTIFKLKEKFENG